MQLTGRDYSDETDEHLSLPLRFERDAKLGPPTGHRSQQLFSTGCDRCLVEGGECEGDRDSAAGFQPTLSTASPYSEYRRLIPYLTGIDQQPFSINCNKYNWITNINLRIFLLRYLAHAISFL